MRKVIFALILVLLPAALWAQSAMRVSSMVGPVEWKAATGRTFKVLNESSQVIQVGDQIRTGSGAQLILQVPDGSYMVVSENSTLTVEDFWSGNLRSLMNLMVGQVRFYIQRLGGRPNPYRVTTPTALIAVRGTVFDVIVDEARNAEVRCLEGRVTVENVALQNREVILDQGFKTLVRPNEFPLMPVRNEAELVKPRIFQLRRKNAPEADANDLPAGGVLAHDNDRGNRINDPLNGANSRTGTSNTERAKPTLSFPQ